MYRGEGMLSALVDDIFKGAEDFLSYFFTAQKCYFCLYFTKFIK
jgi:hypothetical protein